MRFDLLLTCEHGGNRVPARYRLLFASRAARAALASHRGWDPGSRSVARALAHRTGAPLHEARVTRLLVELNRSAHHPRLFSEFSAGLPPDERERLLATYYHPYRDGVERAIRDRLRTCRAVLHVSVHSFSAVWDGQARTAEVGLLYDPGRRSERTVCAAWQAALRQVAPDLRVRRNYPYRGVSDGLVTYLRRRFRDDQYAGVELEMSQAVVATPGRWRQAASEAVATSLLRVLERFKSI